MSKSKNKNMHKFYCLMQLVLENLDDLKVTAPRMIQLKKDIIEMCELLNNEVADTATIQKSTYFHEMTHKIDCIIRKQFDNNM
jgi:hypothetical protein